MHLNVVVISFLIFNFLPNLFLNNKVGFGCYGVPRRGNEPWSVILCKFADIKYEPRPREWFIDWMAGDTFDTIERYFANVSNSMYTIKGTIVHGWLTIPWTTHQIRYLARNDVAHQKSDPYMFYNKARELCINYAKLQGEKLFKQKITIINSGRNALYDRQYGVLLSPSLIFSSVLAHEMVHSFNIGHSYSDRSIKIFPHSKRGEYDDQYDLMSTANAFMYLSPHGLSGPGLVGPHLDYLGWLPLNRIFFFGKDGKEEQTVWLSSLSVPHEHTSDWLLIMIPYDRDDSGNLYTVEFRTSKYLDAGIKQSSIVIHRIQRIGTSYYSMIVTHSSKFYELTEGTEWVHFMDYDNFHNYQHVQVKVLRIDEASDRAEIKIISTFNPEECRSFETKQMLPINRENISYICAINNEAYDEKFFITKQMKRNKFFTNLNTFGMNACDGNKVWRAIDPYDYVCVPEWRRKKVLWDGLRNSRRNTKYGCRKPFVLRSAFDGDNICVTVDEQMQIAKENQESFSNLKYFAFFNGQSASDN